MMFHFKLMVIAWYNALSAFLILGILLSIVGLYFYFRRTRRPKSRSFLPTSRDDEAERVPLGSERVELEDLERAEEFELDEDGNERRKSRKGKGKERSRDEDDWDNGDKGGQTVFALGDEDDDK